MEIFVEAATGRIFIPISLSASRCSGVAFSSIYNVQKFQLPNESIIVSPSGLWPKLASARPSSETLSYLPFLMNNTWPPPQFIRLGLELNQHGQAALQVQASSRSPLIFQ